MPSAALQHKVTTLQNEAALLDEHARVLSNFAHELSSFASTLSYQSHQYSDQSDELEKSADRIMAGSMAMEFNSNSDFDHHGVVARVTRQVAHANETIHVRDVVRRTLHNLTILLVNQSLDVGYEASRSLRRKRLSKETGHWQLGSRCEPIKQEEEEVENALNTLRSYSDKTDSFESPSSVCETEVSSMSEDSDALSALDPGWKTKLDKSDSRKDEEDSAYCPSDEASDRRSESVEAEIYSPDLSCCEEAMVEEKCDTVGQFLRDPYSLATKAHGLGKPTLPRLLLLEAADRVANPNLASGPLVNCAAAFL